MAGRASSAALGMAGAASSAALGMAAGSPPRAAIYVPRGAVPLRCRLAGWPLGQVDAGVLCQEGVHLLFDLLQAVGVRDSQRTVSAGEVFEARIRAQP